MKRNKALLVILAILTIPTIYFLLKNTGTTVKKELRDFAVKDTASVTKIFLADKNGKEITLTRENNVWLLNGKFEPRPDFLKLFFDVLYRVEVRNRVAKAAYNNVVKMLATNGIKCEIYFNNSDTPDKVYYVGGQTEDAMGTFMMFENSTMPFVTQIPGFNGYLTPRYSTDVEAWRNPTLFKVPLNDIAEVSVNYSNFPEKSFSIKSTDNKPTVYYLTDNRKLDNVDSVAIENYLSFYNNVYYESRVTNFSIEKKDSIIQSPPSIIVSLSEKSGKSKSVDIYPMPVTEASLSKTDAEGKPLKFDRDRMYAYIRPDNDLVVVQHFNFDRLLRQIQDFESKPATGTEHNKKF